MLSWIIFLASDGPNGTVRSIRLVSAQQRRYRNILVWYPIQSHISALGTARFQLSYIWRRPNGASWHSYRAPLLLFSI